MEEGREIGLENGIMKKREKKREKTRSIHYESERKYYKYEKIQRKMETEKYREC